MSELAIIGIMLFAWFQGLIVGYIMWGPDSEFKRGFIDGITLKFIWKRLVK
jgi:hypothetical protein